jgi:hypothetical protein
MISKAFKAFIQMHKITYNNKLKPTLHQNEVYKYLGIQLIPSLKWNLQRQISTIMAHGELTHIHVPFGDG